MKTAPFEILDHTGDIKIQVYGQTKEELFVSAVAGMFAVLNPKFEARNPKQKRIAIESPNINSLLVDFLNEINYLRQVNQEVYQKVRFRYFSDTELEAEVQGYPVEEFGEDIKAVTFHDLHIHKNTEGFWETGIIFDI